MPTIRAFLPLDRLRGADGAPVELLIAESLAVLGCDAEPLMFHFGTEELGPVSITPMEAGGVGIVRRPGKRDHTERADKAGLLILVPVRQDSQALRAVRLARGRKIGLDVDIAALAGCYRDRRGGAVLSATSGEIGGIRLCTDGSPDCVLSIIE